MAIKFRLIPPGWPERLMLLMGVVTTGLTVRDWIRGLSPFTGFAINIGIFFLGYAFDFLDQFLFQRANRTESSEYSEMIRQIEGIHAQLPNLQRFLEKERSKVQETEGLINQLSEEKTKLEPLVQTQRETVEAILAAHSQRTSGFVWKERLFGFALGVVSSLIASVMLDYLRHP